MQCFLIVPFSQLFTQTSKQHFTISIFVININRIRTPPLLSRVRYQKKPNQIEHVFTEGDIIHDRTRFRGPEYLVWLAILQCQWISSVDRSAIWFIFWSHIFKDIGEKWWCPYNYSQIYLVSWLVCFLSKSCHILQILSCSTGRNIWQISSVWESKTIEQQYIRCTEAMM